MIIAKFTQYIRPNGREVSIEIEVADDLEDQLHAIRSAGAELTAEVLTTGEVSLTIEEPDCGDWDCIVVSNGPDVVSAVDSLIRRFDRTRFEQWRADFGNAPEE